jgi:hypothetical protein
VPELEIPVRRVTLDICELCLAGDGGECHVPGCAFWMRPAPGMPLRGTDGHLLVAVLRELDEDDA